MDAVILAAGIGSRMQNRAKDTPKCLLNINGTTLLERQIQLLLNNQIQTIYIVGGFQFQKLKQYIDSLHLQQIILIENKDYFTTNNMYSLSLVEPFLKGKDFLWLNGDILFENEIIQEILKPSFQNAIAVDATCYFEESMKVSIQNNQIQAISKEILPSNASGTSIDLYRISATASFDLFLKIQDLLKENKKSWSEVALNAILKLHSFYPCFIHSKWIEIDDIEDLKLAQKLF